jgi:predicted O-methyltransferase YrrM
MIRSENLRSGYLQDDVEEYLYKLLPERDAVVREMEDYAEEHRVPIIGPAVARLLALLVQVSGAKRIFEMGSAWKYKSETRWRW